MSKLYERYKAIVFAFEDKDISPLNINYSKYLLRIIGKPIINYVIEGLRSIRVSEIYILTDSERLSRYLREFWGEVFEENTILTSRNKLSKALVELRDMMGKITYILIANGELIVDNSAYKFIIETHTTSGVDGVFLTVPVTDSETYTTVLLEYNLVKDVLLPPESTKSSIAYGGLSILPINILDYIAEYNDLYLALKRVIGESKIIQAAWNRPWVLVKYPWDILLANRMLLNELKIKRISTTAKIAPSAVIEGPVIIEDNAVIDHNAVIKGPAYIGRETLIGMGAFIREHSSIEDNVIIGAYSEIKRSSIQVYANISSWCFIGDSIVGVSATIGPKVTTLNVLPSGIKISRLHPVRVKGRTLTKLGAIIGTGARVGACTVLYPGAYIDAGEWVKPLSIVEGIIR